MTAAHPLALACCILTVALTGCANLPAPERPELLVRLGQADTLAAPAALDAAGAAFLGPRVAGGGGSTGAGLAGFDRRLLRGASGTPVRQTRSRGIEVGVGMRRDLWSDPAIGRVMLAGSLHLGVSQAAWTLPQGLGLFVDPMQIRLRSHTLTPEVRIVLERPLGPARLEIFAGGGVTLADSRTEVRSALIALDNRHHQTLPWAVAGVGLWQALPGQGRAGLGAQIAGRPGQGVQTRIGLDLRR